MPGTLPLEIASSLRVVLAGDTGVGKTKARDLILNTVPGQVQSTQEPSVSDFMTLSARDNNGSDEDDNDSNSEPSIKGNNDTACVVNNGRVYNESQHLVRGTVSTLEIPRWLFVSTKSSAEGDEPEDGNNNGEGGGDKQMDGDDVKMVPAENVVVHDFVGYGQTLDARETIDRVDTFLTEQYVATLGLFGNAITPLSTATRPGPPSAQQPQYYPFLERLLVDSPMAHSLPDACLYFVLYDLKPVDIIFMRRIMHHINLIPILAKADTLSINQLWKSKARLLKQLQDNQIEFFRFGYTIEELREMADEKMVGGPPFALSTTDLEAQLVGPTATGSLSDLANSINEGKFSKSHSDLALLQSLLLGSKNRMLHQASVEKFMNRWKSDLGLSLEQATPAVAATVSTIATTSTDSPPEINTEERKAAQLRQENAQPSPPTPAPAQVQEQEQTRGLQQHETISQPEPQPMLQQPAAPAPVQQQQHAPVFQQPLYIPQPHHHPVAQRQLPPALQQQTYQPTSSYTSYMAQQSQTNLLSSIRTGSAGGSPAGDDEVAQVIKLNRAHSVIRAASPTTKIYTQGNIIPAIPIPASSPSPLNHMNSPVASNATHSTRASE
ncbi:Neuronal-specific septin-3 [Lobosporangium transversale]|uniref:Septin-type G domain-containing protein n=1 Tax=Lobosporangium transversale TaxID=64571 RepID=A0A1Y2GMF0_9FUNG|nr:hypothetical protein BCR41DRAFT_422892 [Lobosporangium transversale]KAF9915731.1 Neuronal-specific septin-3 [Lobosporangium transversale]ORZ13383.1 hypothetical protein BCR41DRAFT_422892 [Lobosporangium transversale]|eukprot:XP_021880464.1 hypothetical protein BCR41DRAFT_422892 [Lobosporangium transversale]